MAILLNDNLNIAAAKPTDARYGPWGSTSLALANISEAVQRYKGLTVGVLVDGEVIEYWFADGITDDDLTLKTTSGGGGASGATGATGAAGANGSTGATGEQGSTGPSGAQGATGPSGEKGSTGEAGQAGEQGATGETGTQGSTGPSGAQGSTGPSGEKGSTGTAGEKGSTGETGLGFSVFTSADTLAELSNTGTSQNIGQFGLVKGGELYVYMGAGLGATGPLSAYNFVSDLTTESLLIGATGLQGTAGVIGETGATGEQGPTGPSGAEGTSGATGIQGPSGSSGAQGATGPSGEQGTSGATGEQGSTGEAGEQGSTGATGEQGSTGPSGAQGASGATGLEGPTGATGAQGTSGATGVEGPTGATGAQGTSGATGVHGSTGATGEAGPTGATGEAGISDRYQTTSTSTINVDSGSKTLITVDKNLNYTANQSITVSSSAAPSTYMTGTVTSYNKTSGELVFNVTTHIGSGDVTGWVVNLAGAVGAMGSTGVQGATGPQGATGSSGPGAANSLYTTSISSQVQSVLTGGAQPALSAEWQTKTIVEVLDTILFPTLNPTYTNPTLSLGTSQTGVKEVGSTVSQSLTLVGTKNDAGAFTALTVSRTGGAGAGVLATTNSPTVGSATNIADQYGYANPNNDNHTYTLSFNESYVVVEGTTTLSGKGDYSAGSAKKSNKGIDDARTPALRSTAAPQTSGTDFESDSDTITGIYPYYWGKVSTQPSAADIAAHIQAGTGGTTKVISSASGTVSVTFAATNHYIWLALPTGSTVKTKWYNTGLNNGSIGTGNFILAPSEHDVTSQQGYWSNIGYDIYISSGATLTVGAIEFRNN
jgi:collagen type I/II/III/V/XI/XXIV/XXVII alpha